MSDIPSCSLCGSQYTTKVSCPLNPDAKPNPWKVGGVTGDRGNPLKHPNAVEILRKEMEKKTTKQSNKTMDQPIAIAKQANKPGQEIPEFITKNFVFTMDDDSVVINQPLIVKGKLTNSTFTLSSDNAKTVKDTLQELQESDRFGPMEFVGHYNKAGNLVYTSLHGARLPNLDPLLTGFGGYKEGFLAKYKDRLYTFRSIDYGWYPIDSEEPKWDYLLASNMGEDNRNLNLDKYLIVHTISSPTAEALPKKVDIDKIGIDNLHYRNRPIIGPEKRDQVVSLFQEKFALPVRYRSFLREINRGKFVERRSAQSTAEAMKILLHTLKIPEKERKFDTDRIKRYYKSVCARQLNELKNMKNLTRFDIYNIEGSLNDLLYPLFVKRVTIGREFIAHNEDILIRKEGKYPIRSPFLRDIPKDQQLNYVSDLCTLFGKMLEKESLLPSDMPKYQDEFVEILKKYGLLDESYLESLEGTKQGKTESQTELLSLPPLLREGGIYYPGGKDYVAAMEKFSGKGKEAWASWCYTLLDNEHKDDLVAYARTLGLTFDKRTPKSEICLAIIDVKQKEQDESSGYVAKKPRK